MPQLKRPKTFILDTNVILHDSTCIHQFQENDIVIPLAVIEEIDHFKRGSQVINFNAREFARTLDSLTGNAVFDGGISSRQGQGQGPDRDHQGAEPGDPGRLPRRQSGSPDPERRLDLHKKARGTSPSSWSARTSTCG